jgi:hypothetical protein
MHDESFQLMGVRYDTKLHNGLIYFEISNLDAMYELNNDIWNSDEPDFSLLTCAE